jgi:hypothetical protein
MDSEGNSPNSSTRHYIGHAAPNAKEKQEPTTYGQPFADLRLIVKSSEAFAALIVDGRR